jgi:hypothetical protein
MVEYLSEFFLFDPEYILSFANLQYIFPFSGYNNLSYCEQSSAPFAIYSSLSAHAMSLSQTEL